MAVATKVGSFVQPGSTGNQSITGLGFQPKLVIFFMNHRTADGTDTSIARRMFGAATDSTHRSVMWTGIQAGATKNNSMHSQTHCISFWDTEGATATKRAEADFVSMDADGFTVNWGTADATARIINYIAIGGADLTNVFIGTKQLTASTTGSYAVTGVGFQPDSMMFFGATSSSAFDTSLTAYRSSIGFAKSTTSRRFQSINADNSPRGAKRQLSTKILGNTDTFGTVVLEQDITSFDSNGFTVNVSTLDANARYFFYIALKGAQVATGAFNQATSTGNQSVTGVGFLPQGLIFTSNSTTTDGGSLTGDSNSMIGAASSTTARAVIHGSYVQSPESASSDLDRTKCIKTISSGSTVTSAADLVSFDADGFTINNTTVDVSSREILYFAIGSAAVSSPSASLSPSASQSPSASISPSASASASISPSSSLSPSSSISASISPSASRSPSSSISASISPSASVSPSASISPSASTSASISPSSSVSGSISPSSSRSPSASASPSTGIISPSSSISPSISPSASASPSPTPYDLSTNKYSILFRIVYADKYSVQSTSYTDQYTPQDTNYIRKYGPNNEVEHG